jgi:hypothetical protein
MVTVHPPERKGRCKSVVVDVIVDGDVAEKLRGAA